MKQTHRDEYDVRNLHVHVRKLKKYLCCVNMIFNRLSSKDVIKHFERSKEEGKERDCIDIRSNEKDLVRTREASTRDSKEAHMLLLQQLVDHQVNIYSISLTGQKRGGRLCRYPFV